MPLELRDVRELDLTRWIRAGDMIVWGQACAEPRTLTTELLRQRAVLGPLRCFLGIPAADTVRPEHADHITFSSYCGTGGNRILHRAGVLDLVPSHYSTLPDMLRHGPSRADVLLLQLPPADCDGVHGLGLADDYIGATVRTARVVIAEINDRVPRTTGRRAIAHQDLDVVVPTSREPAELPARPVTDTARRIAERVAELVPDEATLQFGIGALPEAILAALSGHRDLGIHSGLLNDAVVGLVESGALTNARKTRDRGVTVAGLLMGSRRLFDLADTDPTILLCGTEYTHDPSILAGQHRFVAINSALEVDLTGQVNAETAGADYVGAVGGATDFLRGAARATDGLPIVALPATAGPRSRIVHRLSGPVSVARSDAGVIVTEFGVADLRGRSLSERRRLMLGLAHPDHRDALANATAMEGLPL